jgi:UDP-N-acetylglucosamine--N-acetylmuramyl-(pentapeptide) pyrophosphoryl-undecaprenol N-acetylglucosamine transferase
LFIAGGLASNQCFDSGEFPFEEVETATFSIHKPIQVLQGCRKIYKGVVQSRKIMRRFHPSLVVGFGSFFTLPVLIAARLENIPIILHEQNVIPGKVNRLFASYAHTTAITFPMTRTLLKSKKEDRVVEVNFPIRKSLSLSDEEIWSYFELSPRRPLLLVFGGSKGAEKINSLFLEALPHLTDVQVLHFTGTQQSAVEARKIYKELDIPAAVKPFEPYMGRAMQIADLAISRAGAGTISELIEYELPALLIPYPHAVGQHQEKNGDHFVSVVKGGRMYTQDELDGSRLAEAIKEHMDQVPIWKRSITTYKQLRTSLDFVDVIRGYSQEKKHE